MKQLGIKHVVWKFDILLANEQRILEADETQGYILANAIDDPRYGRVVSFVFPG